MDCAHPQAGASPTPLGAVVRGAIAGVVGTALMTGWQTLAAKLQHSSEPGADTATPPDPWEQASAPAKVAKRIGEGVFERDVPASLIPLLSNAMHWAYGTGWGPVYAIATSGHSTTTARRGLAFGVAVWAMSYAQLVPMGLYDPPWKYPPQELALDLSYHLVYGLGVAATFKATTTLEMPRRTLQAVSS